MNQVAQVVWHEYPAVISCPRQFGDVMGFSRGSSEHMYKPGRPVASEMPTPRKARACSRPVAHQSSTPPKPVFGLIRLRYLFNHMDTYNCGYVTKAQFMHFRKTEPQLQNLFVDEQAPQHDPRRTGRLEDAMGWQQRAATWEELCCGKENLEWNEFLFFFRRRGFLVEYKRKDRAKRDRDCVAAMLADSRAKHFVKDGQTPGKFWQLQRGHLPERQTQEASIKARLDSPWTFETAGHAVLNLPFNECSTKAPSSRSSSKGQPCSNTVLSFC
mmetsp:Transcript_9195/g.17378  ORF Transcript_9195/g.17378 Transcript_9195/m.17378 type:complete len:271 (+) Transcript_9195:2-814(+)